MGVEEVIDPLQYMSFSLVETTIGDKKEEVQVDVDGVEKILGYRFREPKLLEEALTHRSYYYPVKPCISYERLEFVGDAVLNCLMAKELFCRYRDLSPGPLTHLRAANVDTEKLARVAVKHGLHRFLRHKTPPLDGQIVEFIQAIADYPIHSNGLIDTPKVLADIVESILGAIFVDSGYSLDTVWKVFEQLLKPFIRLETLGKHPVTELHELCQKNGMRVRFVKDRWKENTCVEVLVDEQLMGTAMYGQKREIAQNRAAKHALVNLKNVLVQSTIKKPEKNDNKGVISFETTL